MKKRVNPLWLSLKKYQEIQFQFNRKSLGFTLTEVVITMTILGFIILIIFGSFRLGISAWDKGESIKEDYQKIRIISQMLSQQIKSSIPYKIKTQKGEENYIAFEGKPDSLRFVSSTSLKVKQPEGFVYAIYEFKQDEKGIGHLLFYEQRVLNKDFFEDQPKEELKTSILEGISNIKFQYYREENKDKNWVEEWVDQWNAKEEKELPKALRMIITHKNKRGIEEEFIVIETSLPGYRFEEIRPQPPGVPRRRLQEMQQRRGF
jgi:general secretion pathway protein J